MRYFDIEQQIPLLRDRGSPNRCHRVPHNEMA
jgi:hypothetical protein